MIEEVSREDFDSVVRAVSDIVSGFRPGLSLQTVERTYRAWKSELDLICEVEAYPGGRLLWRGVVPESAGWEEARKRALEEMSSIGGWPLAFSGDEMRLRLSLLQKNELRKLSRYCTVPGLSMLKMAPRFNLSNERKT